MCLLKIYTYAVLCCIYIRSSVDLENYVGVCMATRFNSILTFVACWNGRSPGRQADTQRYQD